MCSSSPWTRQAISHKTRTACFGFWKLSRVSWSQWNSQCRISVSTCCLSTVFMITKYPGCVSDSIQSTNFVVLQLQKQNKLFRGHALQDICSKMHRIWLKSLKKKIHIITSHIHWWCNISSFMSASLCTDVKSYLWLLQFSLRCHSVTSVNHRCLQRSRQLPGCTRKVRILLVWGEEKCSCPAETARTTPWCSWLLSLHCWTQQHHA